MRIVALGLAVLTLFIVSCLGLLGCGASAPTNPTAESRPGLSTDISGASLARHPIAGEWAEGAHSFRMTIRPSGQWILRNPRPDWQFQGRGCRSSGTYRAENATHTLEFTVAQDVILCRVNAKDWSYGLRFGLHRER